MKFNLRSKYLILLVVLAVCAVFVNTWLHVQSTFEARKEEMEARATALGQFIGLNFSDQFLKEESDPTRTRNIKFWLKEVKDAEFLEIYSTDGKKLFSESGTKQDIPEVRKITPSFVQNIVNGSDNFLARRLTDRNVIDFLIPITLFDTEIGLVRLGLDASRYYQQRQEILMTNAQYGFVMLLFITAIGYVVTPYLVQPLRELSTAAERFGQGQFDTRSSVNSGDEIQELSNRFNQMARHIQKLVQNLSDAGEFHRLFPYIIVPQMLYVKIVQQIRESVGTHYAGLLLVNEKNNGSGPVIFADGPNGSRASRKVTVDRELLDQIAELSDRSRVNSLVQRSQKAQELTELFPEVEDKTFADALVFPLERHGRIGYLLLARNDHDFPDPEIQVTQSLLPQIETAISNAQNFEDVLVDERTGLYPRKVMNLALNEVGQFAGTGKLWFGRIKVNISDSDQLKGDPHLEIARFLNKKRKMYSPLEDTDHFFIVSHEQSSQFLAILSGWTRDQAGEIFQNIVEDIDNARESGPDVKAFAGLVSIREDETTDSLLTRCDRALDDAKQQGGASVCFAS